MILNDNAQLEQAYVSQQQEHTNDFMANVGQGNHLCTELTPEFASTCASLNGHVCNTTWQYYVGHTVSHPECLPNTCQTPSDLAHILGAMHEDRNQLQYGRDYALLSIVCPDAMAGDTSHLSPAAQPGRRVVVHRMTLVLRLSIEYLRDLGAFGETVLTELSLATDVDRTRFRVHSVYAGSVIAVIDVLPPSYDGEMSAADVVLMIREQIDADTSPMQSFTYISQIDMLSNVEQLEVEECADGIYRVSCAVGIKSSGGVGAWGVVGICVAVLASLALVYMTWRRCSRWSVPGVSRKDMAASRQLNVECKQTASSSEQHGIVDVDLGPIRPMAA